MSMKFSIGGCNEASGFRSVLNREQSILFPRDVYMDGFDGHGSTD